MKDTKICAEMEDLWFDGEMRVRMVEHDEEFERLNSRKGGTRKTMAYIILSRAKDATTARKRAIRKLKRIISNLEKSDS